MRMYVCEFMCVCVYMYIYPIFPKSAKNPKSKNSSGVKRIFPIISNKFWGKDSKVSIKMESYNEV